MNKIILDLCGGTGSWSKPYGEAGYDVRVITLPENDLCNYVPPDNVYGILFAPPCTVWANSGARWWKDRHPNEIFEASKVLIAGLRIIHKCNPVFHALENPIGRMKHMLGSPQLIFDPCDYGDPYTKKTLLWGCFNHPVRSPVEPIEGSKMHLRYGGKSDRTKEARSITPEGFANAFFQANQ